MKESRLTEEQFSELLQAIQNYRANERVEVEGVSKRLLDNGMLDLSNRPLTEDEIARLSKALQQNTNITSINLSNTEIDSTGVMLLADALKQNNIIFLDLSNNRIDFVATVYYIPEVLDENKNLKTLKLAGNDLEVAEIKEFQKFTEQHKITFDYQEALNAATDEAQGVVFGRLQGEATPTSSDSTTGLSLMIRVAAFVGAVLIGGLVIAAGVAGLTGAVVGTVALAPILLAAAGVVAATFLAGALIGGAIKLAGSVRDAIYNVRGGIRAEFGETQRAALVNSLESTKLGTLLESIGVKNSKEFMTGLRNNDDNAANKTKGIHTVLSKAVGKYRDTQMSREDRNTLKDLQRQEKNPYDPLSDIQQQQLRELSQNKEAIQPIRMLLRAAKNMRTYGHDGFDRGFPNLMNALKDVSDKEIENISNTAKESNIGQNSLYESDEMQGQGTDQNEKPQTVVPNPNEKPKSDVQVKEDEKPKSDAQANEDEEQDQGRGFGNQ